MGTIRTCTLASLASLAACGGGSSNDVDALIIIPDAAIDAAPDAFELVFDFSCLGNAQGTADANLTLAGFVGEVVSSGGQPSLQAAHDADVAVCADDCMNANELFATTTPSSGCPAMGCPFTSDMLATGGSPLDVYVKLTKTGNRPTYVYPPAPLTTSFNNIPGVMFTPAVIQLLGVLGVTQTAGNGNLLIAVADCSNMPISDTPNLTLTVKQNGTAVANTTILDISQFSPQLAGTFAVFNVPPGVTEIGATYKDKTLRAHDVTVFADSSTASAVRPGF